MNQPDKFVIDRLPGEILRGRACAGDCGYGGTAPLNIRISRSERRRQNCTDESPAGLDPANGWQEDDLRIREPIGYLHQQPRFIEQMTACER